MSDFLLTSLSSSNTICLPFTTILSSTFSTTHPLPACLFFLPLVENVQLSLVLQTENKGSVVAGGELNVCLDGMVVDLGSLPNGSTAADSESCLYHTHTRTHSLARRGERNKTEMNRGAPQDALTPQTCAYTYRCCPLNKLW